MFIVKIVSYSHRVILVTGLNATLLDLQCALEFTLVNRVTFERHFEYK